MLYVTSHPAPRQSEVASGSSSTALGLELEASVSVMRAEEEWECLGVDPIFPGSGEVYKVGDYMLNDLHGGRETRKWLDHNFEAREDDVYVVSFPKTGTTWAQEITYVIGNDLDFDKAKSTPIAERFPYLELKFAVERGWINHLQSPRFIKSHFPYSLLPRSIVDKNCKIIYTIRNPKDTLVSSYHFSLFNNFLEYQGDFQTFFDYFVEDRLLYTPFWKHVLEFWERRDEENILILQYENMKKDLQCEIRKIASFLGKVLSEEQVAQVADHCSFEQMKQNPTTNYKAEFGKTSLFMRKGKVGDWKNHFTQDMTRKMDEYMEKHFRGTRFQFGWD